MLNKIWSLLKNRNKITFFTTILLSLVIILTFSGCGENGVINNDNEPPVINSFKINNGDSITTEKNVILNNSATNNPNKLMVSEDENFLGEEWQPYSQNFGYELSSNYDSKTVYFKVRNEAGLSDTVYDNIKYKSPIHNIDSTYVGSDSTLDVMTWNIEHFPLQGEETVTKVSEIINTLNLDMIVLQEIESANDFENVISELGNWDGYRANSASYDINLALVYNTNTITINDTTEIFTQDWWAFPRNPLVIDCYFNDKNYIVINNHLKALSGEENVERREAACESLKVYIDDNFSEKRVILLGDLNDSLTDPEADNVFWQFIADSTNYKFADMAIAQGSTTYWSYPSWPSHLDHILITDELFEAWESGSTMTLLLDEYYEDYLYTISDHRPVLIKLKTE